MTKFCCCCSVAKSCPTLCKPMDCSTPGAPVPHCFLEFTQVHVRWINDAIQLSATFLLLLLPSIFPSISVFSNHSALRIWWPNYWSFSSASVLPVSIQGWFPLGLTGLISLQAKGLSRDRNLFLHNSRGWKLEMKFFTNLVSSEVSSWSTDGHFLPESLRVFCSQASMRSMMLIYGSRFPFIIWTLVILN